MEIAKIISFLESVGFEQQINVTNGDPAYAFKNKECTRKSGHRIVEILSENKFGSRNAAVTLEKKNGNDLMELVRCALRMRPDVIRIYKEVV